MSFIGSVEDNTDPERLGRIKVSIPPYDGMTTDQLPWAAPLLGACGNSPSNGGLNIPEIGSQVRISFPTHDFTAPFYSGAELNDKNRTTFFDEDYPHTYGYKDSTGNFVKVNKAAETIEIQHSSSTNLKVAPDGSVKLALSNGAYFTFDNDKAFTLSIGALVIEGQANGSLTVTSSADVSINAPTVAINADSIKLNGGVDIAGGASGSFTANGSNIVAANGVVTYIPE